MYINHDWSAREQENGWGFLGEKEWGGNRRHWGIGLGLEGHQPLERKGHRSVVGKN